MRLLNKIGHVEEQCYSKSNPKNTLNPRFKIFNKKGEVTKIIQYVKVI